MSTFENTVWWIALLGSVASIGSAVWAYVEARKAKEAVRTVQRLHNEIVTRRRIIETSGIYGETKRFLTSISRVGPSSNATISKGISGWALAGELREYVLFLSEHIQDFPEPVKGRVQSFVEGSNDDIRCLAEAKTFHAKKSASADVYYKIQALMPEFKTLADETKELSPEANGEL
jgi:hypothetical protein